MAQQQCYSCCCRTVQQQSAVGVYLFKCIHRLGKPPLKTTTLSMVSLNQPCHNNQYRISVFRVFLQHELSHHPRRLQTSRAITVYQMLLYWHTR